MMLSMVWSTRLPMLLVTTLFTGCQQLFPMVSTMSSTKLTVYDAVFGVARAIVDIVYGAVVNGLQHRI